MSLHAVTYACMQLQRLTCSRISLHGATLDPMQFHEQSEQLTRILRCLGGVRRNVINVKFWKMWKMSYWGRGEVVLKCLKSISSHFGKINFRWKIGGYQFTNFSNAKNFYKCFDLSGGQKKLCPKSGLVSLKKYIVFFVTLGGGSNLMWHLSHIFFIFLKASLSSFEIGGVFSCIRVGFLFLILYI